LIIVIASNGPHTGKTFVGNLFNKLHNYEIINYGDYVKSEVAYLINALPSTLFQLLTLSVGTTKALEALSEIDFSLSIAKHFHNMMYGTKEVKSKYRRLMQYWGTDIRRALDPDYWCKRLIQNIDPSKNYVITDCRFDNEVNFFNQFKTSENKPLYQVKSIYLFNYKLPVQEHASEKLVGDDFNVELSWRDDFSVTKSFVQFSLLEHYFGYRSSPKKFIHAYKEILGIKDGS
jgi:hypothetical protein